MPEAGVEPARYRYHWILSPARLPIPSFRRILTSALLLYPIAGRKSTKTLPIIEVYGTFFIYAAAGNSGRGRRGSCGAPGDDGRSVRPMAGEGCAARPGAKTQLLPAQGTGRLLRPTLLGLCGGNIVRRHQPGVLPHEAVEIGVHYLKGYCVTGLKDGGGVIQILPEGGVIRL